MSDDVLLFPPGIPVLLDCGGVVSLLHEGAIPLELDGLREGHLSLVLLLSDHIRGLLLGLHHLGCVSAHQHSEHLILLEHINQ